jgi:preprotein translocase subunit SecA
MLVSSTPLTSNHNAKPVSGYLNRLKLYQSWLKKIHQHNAPLPDPLDPQWRRQLAQAELGDPIWIEACALVQQTCIMHLNIQPYDTQWLAAMTLLDGRLAEMATGEGKTLSAGLAASVAALCNQRVHILTANAYLVERDAEELAPLYVALHLTHATADESHPPEQRREAYLSNIVYATARTVTFDSLRDQIMAEGRTGTLMLGTRVLTEGPQATPLLPKLETVFVDEADSILIDEASVPLIISIQRPDAKARARTWSAWKLASRLKENRDYKVIDAQQKIQLKTEQLPPPDPVWINTRQRNEMLETALRARHFFIKDKDYVVKDDQICLIDKITGRIAEGRVWSRGLHPLVALKERLPLPPETHTVAQTTYPDFFKRYNLIGGMSGTLQEVSEELAKVYSLKTVTIPLRKPCQRQIWPLKVFDTEKELMTALIERIKELTHSGRPILIGTDTVAHSMDVSRALSRADINHQVLNAEQSAEEANIVAKAGQSGAVTVATNVAGRGTDIRLTKRVVEAGGLHLLSLQTNPSKRQDRQLIGRCARQGDPGSAEQWHSIERMEQLNLPLTFSIKTVRAILNKPAAELLLPAARYLYQAKLSAIDLRQRLRIQSGALYWDRHLPTSYKEKRQS